MKDWLDSPVSGVRQRIESDYWCRQCKERYTVVLRFDNETGDYWGEVECPLCGHDGVVASEADDNVVE